jgi:hypothetical protein
MPRQPKDPLAHLLARRRISRSQHQAALEFRKCFAAAQAGDRHNAGTMLCRCYDSLGADGASVVTDAVVRGMTVKEIAESRGKTGPDWTRFYSRRLWECLNTLTEVFGITAPSSAAPHPTPPAAQRSR